MKRIVISVVAIVTTVLVAYLAFGNERYCIIYPGVDTKYAAGFSERKFAQVQVGMTSEQVIALIGAPFGRTPGRASGKWSYTQDGKCFWTDWAWLGREVVFGNDRVVQKVARVYFD